MRRIFSFPDPVNEVAARFVAGGVVLMSTMAIAFELRWMLVVLAYGFLARTLTGPTLSPLGQFVTRAAIPYVRIWPRSSPARRSGSRRGSAQPSPSAQWSSASASASLGWRTSSLASFAVAATSEAAFGFCVGCAVFARLMQWGVIPQTVCERCATFGAPARRTHTLAGAGGMNAIVLPNRTEWLRDVVTGLAAAVDLWTPHVRHDPERRQFTRCSPTRTTRG